jgi:hypothetical protein
MSHYQMSNRGLCALLLMSTLAGCAAPVETSESGLE